MPFNGSHCGRHRTAGLRLIARGCGPVFRHLRPRAVSLLLGTIDRTAPKPGTTSRLFKLLPKHAEAIPAQTALNSIAHLRRMYYILQAISAAGVLTMIVAIVLCFKPPAPRRKWLWLTLVLLGYAYVSLHPAANSYELKAAYVAFLAASRMEQLVASPEDVGVVIPFGALIFLALRRSLLPKNGT